MTLTVVNCTIASNVVSTGTGSGGIQIYAPVTVKNTLLAHNDNGNCDVSGGGNLISHGHNLDSGYTCGFAAAGDLVGTDPLLDSLRDNGGPATGPGQATLTHALLPGSPAIDAGDDIGCPPTDQRGVARPQSEHCDIGAYECADIAPVAPTGVTVGGPTMGIIGTSYGFTAIVSPPTVTHPLTYTWSPTPISGQGSATATYGWTVVGTKTITIMVENIFSADPVLDTHEIIIVVGHRVYLPLMIRDS
jgi:hypothetical protein